MAPVPRTRPYAGPHLLSYGFRPFFLMGSLFAGAAVLLWLPAYFGEITIPTAFAPRDWHIHEMLFGFVPAIVTGFLLTAIPNWTGRLPLQGTSLLVLALAWIAGRLACAFSGWIGWQMAAIIDLAFLLLVALAATREVVAGKNWRNLRVVVIVALLIAGNLVFHLEAHANGVAEVGTRIGIAAAVLLVALIGGRIIPSFTRNWLARENPGRLPASFGRYDALSLAATAIAMASWIARPAGLPTAGLLALAAVLDAVRLARWAGERTLRDRLVLVLHVAFGFLPVGLLLLACAAAGQIPVSAGIHALSIGCIGLMTVAVMSRASLGHTGRALVASRAVQAVYALIAVAALARIAAALRPDASIALLHVAALLWAAGFIGFALAYWKIFTGPRFVR